MIPRSFHLRIAGLLFGSGLCALVYQTVWLREFRLIFGSSTAASAAVLGIFMGGLGLGSALLGKRAERAPKPLEYYAKLEILISLSVALTPLLFWLIRWIYIASGGSPVMGHTWATIVRLLLSALVLAVPTFLMGGTLPAAARAAESEEDEGRRRLALLYGCNTLGAVAGAALSTFFLIEHLGNRQTLFLACGVNLLIAMLARLQARSMPVLAVETHDAGKPAEAPVMPLKFAVLAAGGVGWAFMLMELVWYRMLGPILGGSTFTFGLILVMALLGIGLGGGIYSLFGAKSRPTVNGFAATCAIEALCIAIPFALGDRLAMLAMQLRTFGAFGFGGHLLAWAAVTGIVVLPAAIVAGYQFPMLIALLGRGREGVGRDTGLAYAANTTGAIIGSLGGGFGLLPLLTAQGAWKLVALSLILLAGGAILVARRAKETWRWTSICAAGLAAALLFTTGPTAAWRHSGIGAGRASIPVVDHNSKRNFENFFRRQVAWEADGVESSVALAKSSAYSFVVNGKVDGNARMDAGTQVMAGMVGAILHPKPKRAMVIGLGTGSTAGWLASISTIERVDVVELEEAIIPIAEACAPVNQDVLKNPKVHIHIGDAREALLTKGDKYDLIFSEPSNPYRAGIASLFSQDFYRAITGRLADGGIFMQWVQLYDVDAEAVHTVYATLGSVFPYVETWHTQVRDLLLIATREPLPVDVGRVRERVAMEPFKSALLNAWRIDSAEGFLSHYMIGNGLARLCVESGIPVSTDDRSALEFGFARSVGRGMINNWDTQIDTLARQRGWFRPATVNGEVDWTRVDAQRYSQRANAQASFEPMMGETKELAARRMWVEAVSREQMAQAGVLWKEHRFEPLNPLETQYLARMLTELRAPEAEQYLKQLEAVRPTDAAAIRVRALALAGKGPEALELLGKVFANWHTDPWVTDDLGRATLSFASGLLRVSHDPGVAERLYESLRTPFAIRLHEEQRILLSIDAARASGAQASPRIAEALKGIEPNVPWDLETLQRRALAYQALGDPLLPQALDDLAEFMAHEAPSFDSGLAKAPAAKAEEGASARPAGTGETGRTSN